MVTEEDVHVWLASENQFMWAGIDVSTPIGRRKAAKWFIEQLDELSAFVACLDEQDDWRLEARQVAQLEAATTLPSPDPRTRVLLLKERNR